MAECSTYHNDLTDYSKDSDTLLGGRDHGEKETAPTRWRSYRGLGTVLMFALVSLLCILLAVDITLRFTTLTEKRKDGNRLHRSFGSNESYMSLDHKYDYLWDHEFAANNAVVYIPPDGKSQGVGGDEEIEPGAITMFHQLHCLTSIRKIMQFAREGGQIGLDNRDDHHWPHCLYYLRQAILCNADGTIERAPPMVNGTRGMINGAHDMRVCRDPSELYELREKYGSRGKKESLSGSSRINNSSETI
ncbi:uncharacterized protein Z519_05323 [Cladophialophora bantiana CBS 173.52]|uniref:Oxidase ustYa n=1 Tax=Cladophialophora bantiana (strain ATCC 10958 / CBS 173.52 / CDC B-1940 / NIH 8579) TaxID=1442370 RepID=A0A0D2G607_CLAB1|nr:uncharacterized protein Z519_05323 [Cladophialophora bantiana CBS 173.52]KIW94007.1 hypothetical protein Z519_05323 [Cladophialophora bantiana CBS 173.52]